MNHPNSDFIQNFIRKSTKEQIVEKHTAEAKAFAKLHAESKTKPMNLTEATKEALVEVINKSVHTKPKTQPKLKIQIPLNEQLQSSQIEVKEPLVVKDNKIQIDLNKLTDLFADENAITVQKTLEAVRTKNLDGGIGGGGGIGIISEDESGNKIKVIRSAGNLIIRGPGVQVERKGKDVELYISGSIDTNTDFPREATMLELYELIQDINENVSFLTGQEIPTALGTVDLIDGGIWE